MKETTPAAPIVFVHIPKAAGTSLKDLLSRVYAGRPCLFFLPGDGRLERFGTLPAASRAACALVAGHEPYGMHRVFDGTGVEPRVITVLREPVARVVSLYRYIFREPGHFRHRAFVSERPSVRDVYAEASFRPFDNQQVRFLAGRSVHDKAFGAVDGDDLERAVKALEDGVHAFGLQERMADSVRHFASVLGWPSAELPELNRGEDRAGVGIEPPEVTAEDRAAIAAANAFDVALYERAAAVFAKRVGEESGDGSDGGAGR